MVFGIKRKKDNTSESFREDGGNVSEKKSFQELNKEQDKIFGTWEEDKKQGNDSDTWEE